MELQFIPKKEREAHKDIILGLANVIYGCEEQISFTEAFIPFNGRVPSPKASNFANYLIRYPNLLWVIKFKGEAIGFIIVSNLPFKNSFGVSINRNFARQGFIQKAFNIIKYSKEINYPLFAYTSIRNVPAKNLLIKLGFDLTDEKVQFMGEDSCKFELAKPEELEDIN